MTTDEKIDALTQEVKALRQMLMGRGLASERERLSLRESIEYVGHNSPSAFYRWCERWGVYSRNRKYLTTDLNRGIEREKLFNNQ